MLFGIKEKNRASNTVCLCVHVMLQVQPASISNTRALTALVFDEFPRKIPFFLRPGKSVAFVIELCYFQVI